ncbi:ATP-dependent DNA/RNA helicase dhx36 [Rhizophlyctis rosea]|uniref:ATP-dependent DNA/RNA helicase dhx36 n=1 Tax=Rhizophlyctis rosea TaxID=64517 RepID=A0AAD5X8J0_9FUNG|nr:ATP-dependent DNA/RNA helicase dhx36 [Rhizophlyctis rosea]
MIHTSHTPNRHSNRHTLRFSTHHTLLASPPAAPAPPRAGAGPPRARAPKGMNAAPTGSGKGKGRGRNLEPWEVEATSINVRGLKQEERRVPSAWDDEDEDIPIPTGSASASRMSRMSIDDDRDSGRSAWDSGTWGGGTGGSGSLKQPVNGDVQDGRMNPERLAFLDGSGGGTPSSTQDSRSSRVPFSPHRDKRRHTEQYAREQSSYSPPAIPRPNATLPHMDDVQRKFAAFYCKRNQLPAPYPHWHPAKPERGVSQGGWIARLTVPRHTFGGRQVGPIVGEGLARTKKDAGTRAWDMFTAHLLSIVDQGYVEQFRSLTMPFKERLKEVLDQPLKIDVVEGVLVRLGKICGELEEAAAFRIPKEREESNGQGGDLLGSLSRADSGWARGTGRAIRPEDVEIPSGLGGQDLPVVGKFREIVSAIEGNNVVVLSAETGAGKTTQVPQFILAWQRWKDANPWWEDKFGIDEERASASGRLTPASVIVTQPRRIAAISVAQRVASERGEMVGSGRCAVGYQVRFENKAPTVSRDEGRMVFCTSGILLRRFQDDPLLTGVTHIILDEVHERDLNTDLLLIIIRHLLHRRPDIKVILMSATAETELFQNYFKGFGTVGHNRLPPIVSVPGRLFPVKENHLEDVMEIVERWGVGGDLRGGRAGIRPRWDVKTERFLKSELDGISPSARRHAQEEDIPLDVLEALIAHISLTHPPGAILVFLPGWQEINGLMEMIKQDRYNVGFRDEGRFRVLPLHSSVPMQAQAEVFKSFGDRVRKVVLSTNIAETSVTINDVVYVIDSGKMRQNSYDADRRISSLASVWGSQSNIKQRIGRAGRCQPGIYYSLMSRHRRRKLPYSMPPELLRVDLQSTVLKIKALHLAKSSREVFAAAPEPPSSSNVYLAIDELKSLGALDDQENMTPLGKVLSELPVDPWIGKMVLQGAVLGVLDPIVTIAGGMEVGRGIYAIHPDEKQAAREWILKRFARGMESDQLTMWKAFEGWRKAEAQGGWAAGRDFAASNWLHVSSLTNVEKARKQFLKVLEDCRVVERSSGRWRGFREERSDELLGGEENNVNSQELDMVRAVLCGALYPNLAEIVAKDEYRGKSDWKLRLTGSSVNSWTGIMGSKGVAPTDGVGISRAGAHASADSMSVVSDFDDIDDGASNAEAPSDDSAALPPRLLCYQDKQQVDGGIYMRHTTKADPIGVALFANSRQVRLRDVQGQPGVIIDNWLAVQMGDSRRRQVIMDVREWIARYLDWAVWRRAGGGVGRLSGDEVLGGVYGGDGEGEELGGGDDAGNIREAMKSRNNVHLEWESLGRRLVKEVAMLVQAACERERERLQ